MTRPRKTPEQTTSTLYQGADGKWHARVTMGRRPDGTTARKHVQRGTKAELRDAVRDLERRRDAGTFVWTQDDVTLSHWLEHWLESVLPMTARWKTVSTYRSQMRVHAIPALGQWRLSELRPEHLEEHYRRMQDEGHSTHVIRAVHRVLRSSLNEPWTDHDSLPTRHWSRARHAPRTSRSSHLLSRRPLRPHRRAGIPPPPACQGELSPVVHGSVAAGHERVSAMPSRYWPDEDAGAWVSAPSHFALNPASTGRVTPVT